MGNGSQELEMNSLELSIRKKREIPSRWLRFSRLIPRLLTEMNQKSNGKRRRRRTQIAITQKIRINSFSLSLFLFESLAKMWKPTNPIIKTKQNWINCFLSFFYFSMFLSIQYVRWRLDLGNSWNASRPSGLLTLDSLPFDRSSCTIEFQTKTEGKWIIIIKKKNKTKENKKRMIE